MIGAVFSVGQMNIFDSFDYSMATWPIFTSAHVYDYLLKTQKC